MTWSHDTQTQHYAISATDPDRRKPNVRKKAPKHGQSESAQRGPEIYTGVRDRTGMDPAKWRAGRSTEPLENRKPGTLYLDHELIISRVSSTSLPENGGRQYRVMALNSRMHLSDNSAGKAAKKTNKKKKKSGKGVEDYSKYWEDGVEGGVPV